MGTSKRTVKGVFVPFQFLNTDVGTALNDFCERLREGAEIIEKMSIDQSDVDETLPVVDEMRENLVRVTRILDAIEALTSRTLKP